MKKEILCLALVLMFVLPCYAKQLGKVIVVYNTDKTVSIIYPAPKAQKVKETDQEFLARVYQRSIKGDKAMQGSPYEIINVSSLPSREYRDAWEGELGKGVKVNQEKAKQIEKELMKQQILEEEKDKILEEMAIQRLQEQGKM